MEVKRQQARCVLRAAIVIVAMVATAGCARAADMLSLAAGQSSVVTLEENPSTGFRWHINAAGSSGLSSVRIEDLGLTEAPMQRPLVGASGQRRWLIEGARPGRAHILLEYTRPWEHKEPARRHEVTVDVNAR